MMNVANQANHKIYILSHTASQNNQDQTIVQLCSSQDDKGELNLNVAKGQQKAVRILDENFFGG